MAPATKSACVIFAALSFVITSSRAEQPHSYVAPDGEFFGVDASKTVEAVKRRIPIGAPISVAKTTMENNGFRCTSYKNELFSYDISDNGQQNTHPPTNYLWCDSGERVTVTLIVSKRWQVIFVDHNGTVSKIYASVGLTGL